MNILILFYCIQITKNRVCVLSGGGSGHEPFAAGILIFHFIS